MRNRRLLLLTGLAGAVVAAAVVCGCSWSGWRWPGVSTGEEAKATAPAPKGVAAAAPAAPVVQRVGTLPNGLRVVVREKRIGGVAALRIYLRAGSLNEGQYAGSGISHLLEHVVAGGATPKRSEDQARDALAAIGADTNAHTSKQFVCYHGQVSAEHIDTLIDILADFVMNARIEQKAFDREFEVVQRELERAEADPDHILWTLADETFFLSHPARYPVIGYLAALRRLRHEDLVRYYKRVAVPENAVVVAVGDFDSGAVYEKIRKAMGAWARLPAETTVLPPREPQVAARHAEAEMDVAAVRTVIEFPTVQLTHPDLYPLDILAFILGEGRASRLVSDLRDKRGLVESVSVGSFTPAGYDGGSFVIVMQTEPAKAEAARKAVSEHLARVIREKPTDEELARAKRQKIAQRVFGLQGSEEIADDLGTNALLLGDPDFSDRYTRNIQRTTAEDVQRVAAAYLTPETVTVVTVMPKRGAAVAAATPETPLAAPGATRPQIIPHTLPNGVRLLFCPMPGEPTVSIQMFMRGGLSVESDTNAGISYFMANLMLKGTARHKAADIAQALDAMGAEMAAAAGRNTVYVSARCLAPDFEKTFDLAAECLLEPAFPPDEVERTRELILAELAQMADSPHGEAALYFDRVFFRDSPYKFPVQGTPEVVKSVSRDALASWHKKYVAANNLVVAVFGGIDLAKAARRVAAAVGGVAPNKELAFPADVAPRAVAAREVYVKPSEKGAAIVYVAYPGMDIYNRRDRFPMDILDTIVSGYQMPGGWLHEELRGKGLVYEVHAFSMEGLRPGYFTAMAVCQPAKVAEVVAIIEAAMKRAVAEAFSEGVLAPARATVITAKQLGRETVAGWAFEAAVDEVLGLGYGFPLEEIDLIRQVRPEEVSRVAREYLKKPVIVIVTGDPAAAQAVPK
jgi:zinc protease